MSEEIKFEVGDRVAAFGCEGVVTNVDSYVTVQFEKDDMYFHLDGRVCHWHKEPSLVLVEKAKKEVLLHEYLVRYNGKAWTEFYKSDEEFKKYWPTEQIIKTGRTATVKE